MALVYHQRERILQIKNIHLLYQFSTDSFNYVRLHLTKLHFTSYAYTQVFRACYIAQVFRACYIAQVFTAIYNATELRDYYIADVIRASEINNK